MINEVDKVEILTLQDNYIDLTATDNNQVIARAMPLKDGLFKKSVLSEHGFSAIVKTTTGNRTRAMLFDFGFSDIGAAFNAEVLGQDMTQIEALALSHGHTDHTGGLVKLIQMIGKKGIEFVVHPSVFKSPRYLKYSEERKVFFPAFSRQTLEKSGVRVVETNEPYLMLNGDVLFLGEVERQTDFEKGFPIARVLEDGVEKADAIEDDTSIVMNVKGKGLVVLSGCAHAGIINTVIHATAVTGMKKVHAVMGGFHLSGPLFEPIIGRTTEELRKINPTFVIPTHCTGRKAIIHMEKEMPGQFILNMSGTKLTFSS
ncbi:MAG TPA: MBL fold metallo-hydrolase [Syntrophales bacterium]|nr:MBL fold metallo-hydrolase [Syntrophales bacterium]